MEKHIIGKRVRRQRESLNMTRERFAEQIDISPQFLAEIENGKKGMSADTLRKICEYSGASADYILLGKVENGVTTPAGKLLNSIPPQYTVLLEDVIRSFKEVIELSEEKNER